MTEQNTPTSKIKIKNGIQVCVIVKNLKEAMGRYHSLFGIGPFEVYTVDTKELPGVTHRGQPGDYRVTVAMAKIGTGMLELLESGEICRPDARCPIRPRRRHCRGNKRQPRGENGSAPRGRRAGGGKAVAYSQACPASVGGKTAVGGWASLYMCE